MQGIPLLSKNGVAVTKIARELLTYEVGSKIPRIQDFADNYKVGRGTIQNALQLLIDSQAIQLESRGHLGTYCMGLNFIKLWSYAGLSSVMGAMPLPYSRRNEGLATGLYEEFERINFPFHLSYMRGAANRINALIEGRYDFVIVSKRTAYSIDDQDDLAVLFSFGKQTYVKEHVLLVRNPEYKAIKSGLRVGVDTSSADQRALTYEMCKGLDIEYAELPYVQIMEQLLNGMIDAAIWNSDEIEHRFGTSGPLYEMPLGIKQFDYTNATLLVRRSDYSIYKKLISFVDVNRVLEIQNDVLKGNRIPHY